MFLVVGAIMLSGIDDSMCFQCYGDFSKPGNSNSKNQLDTGILIELDKVTCLWVRVNVLGLMAAHSLPE